MNERVTELARELVKLYGFSLLDDPERLGQLLEDKCGGEDRHDIFLLCFALRDVSKKGVLPAASELRERRADFERGLRENLGFSQYAASGSLDSIIAIVTDAEAIEEEEHANGHVEARRGFLHTVFKDIAKRPRTAPARKKALRNGLLLLAIALLFLGFYVRVTESRFVPSGESLMLFLAHLSGSTDAGGQVRLKAAQLAADMINAQGGVKGTAIRIIVRDVPRAPEAAALAVGEYLRKRPVSVMISVCGDDVNEAIAELADSSELPLVMAETERADLTMEGPDRPRLYSFRANFDSGYAGRLLAYFAVKALKRKSAALIAPSYSSDAPDITSAFEEAFTSYGGEISVSVTLARRSGLDAASASAVAASGADCVILADTTGGAAQALIALRAAGYSGTVVGLRGAEDIGREAGAASENCWWIVPSSQDDPQLMSFQTSYRDKYNETVGRGDFIGAVLAFDSVRWAADALSRAPGYQGEALRHAFLSTRNLALTHATLSVDPRTHGPWNKAAALLYSTEGKTRFQRRFAPK